MRSDVLRFWLLVVGVVLLVVGVFWFDVVSVLSVERMREVISGYGMAAPLVFVFVYVLATVCMVPGTPLTIVAGIVFGVVWGTVYAVIGATLGAVVVFVIVRSLGEEFVERFVRGRSVRLAGYYDMVEERGLSVVFFLRLVPLFPFNGLNVALALTRVRLWDYVVGTFVGIIPGAFVLAYFGDSLAMFRVLHIVIAVVLFVLLSLIPVVYRMLKKK